MTSTEQKLICAPTPHILGTGKSRPQKRDSAPQRTTGGG